VDAVRGSVTRRIEGHRTLWIGARRVTMHTLHPLRGGCGRRR
jgi:hypothetical protein